jgi:hypothetical protein
MFKFVAGLLALAFGVSALPATVDIGTLPEGFTFDNGVIRPVSGGTLGVYIPRSGVSAPTGFNMCVLFDPLPI